MLPSPVFGLPTLLSMKKNLYTCFLVPIAIGMLCLVGRYLVASDKVADSPGADFPHRSVPYRGGDSRSEFTQPDIVGLVERDPDSGRGSLQVAHRGFAGAHH